MTITTTTTTHDDYDDIIVTAATPTQSSSILFEKLTVCQLLNQFSTLQEARCFITEFKKSRQWSLSQTKLIQSITSNRIFISISILSSNHAQVFRTVYFRHASKHNFVHTSNSPCVLRSLPISSYISSHNNIW